MLTYSFDQRGGDSLYTHLYKCIRGDITAYRLSPGEKLPSKRALAKHLGISTVTVENAYQQLLAEGYIYSRPKSGFFVSDMPRVARQLPPDPPAAPAPADTPVFADFNSNSSTGFPFSLWTRLMRQTMSDDAEKLMVKSPSAGVWELREAIAGHLLAFRGIRVHPDQILVGAGTEYLYGLIIQLLGQEKVYALEDPGYQTVSSIYRANRVSCLHIPMDEQGVDVDALERSGAQVLHLSPSHHFPSGLVTPINRRYALLSWAARSPDRFIIEDDYDSEFRLQGRPIPSLQSIDAMDKVIYMNTFSKTLAATIRISYMVLPPSLMARYQKLLGFYSCTVSNFEQYTLARFIRSGSFETHINRMRNYYRTQRDALIAAIRANPDADRVEILEADAGLHFLLRVDTPLRDSELVERAAAQGIRVSCLSQYYVNPAPQTPPTLVLNYSGLDSRSIPESVQRLYRSLRP